MKPLKHFLADKLVDPAHPIYITVIGVGGTGTLMISALARINASLLALGHPGLYVIAYDSDMVTQPNVGRQLFFPQDIGRNKATVMIERINRAFGFAWDSREEDFKVDAMASLSGNILITCVDKVMVRSEIGKINPSTSGDPQKAYYWLDIGNTRTKGQVILGTIGELVQPKSKNYKPVSGLKTVTEMFQLEKFETEDQGPSCSTAEALRKQDLFINSTLVQFAGNLIWKLLTDFSITYQGVFLNLETMSTNPIKLQKKK